MKKTLLLAASGLLSFSVWAQEATFTSSGTWTVPAGVTTIEVAVTGAGGNGNINGSGGGGGGGYASGTFTVTPGSVLTITVGTAGSSVATSVMPLGIQATPGVSSVYNSSALGGAGGVGSGGTVNYTGGMGGNGTYTYFGGGGGGAAGPEGNGGAGGSAIPWSGICLYPGGAGGIGGGGTLSNGGKGAGFVDAGCSSSDPATPGGSYGGGGGGGNGVGSAPSNGGNGYVRINWCGTVAPPTGAALQIFCQADSATVADLTATGTGIQWYTSVTGGTALAATDYLVAGTYYATQIESGCESSTRLPVEVQITNTPAPGGPATQSFCFNDDARVSDLLPGGTNINWYNSATGGTSLTASMALANGVYYATQVVSGCESVERLATTVSITTVDVNTTVSENTITATAAGATFQWINCSDMQNIPGATNASYTATENGSYAVIVTQNGCSDTSACVAIVGVGVNQVQAEQTLSIYPNPAHETISVKTAAPLTGTEYYITDATGRKIISGKLSSPSTEISIRHLAKGVYYFHAGQQAGSFKVVKH